MAKAKTTQKGLKDASQPVAPAQMPEAVAYALKLYPDVDRVYESSDGQVFLHKPYAENAQKQIAPEAQVKEWPRHPLAESTEDGTVKDPATGGDPEKEAKTGTDETTATDADGDPEKEAKTGTDETTATDTDGDPEKEAKTGTDETPVIDPAITQ